VCFYLESSFPSVEIIGIVIFLWKLRKGKGDIEHHTPIVHFTKAKREKEKRFDAKGGSD
jgi:hypothetical protein